MDMTATFTEPLTYFTIEHEGVDVRIAIGFEDLSTMYIGWIEHPKANRRRNQIGADTLLEAFNKLAPKAVQIIQKELDRLDS